SFDGMLKSNNIQKYTYTLTQSEKQELNLENGDFKLMRTVFNNTGNLRVFLGTKMGAVSGNDITVEGLKKLITDGIAAAESAEEDPCHDIAPDQGKDVFRQGVYEPDMDRFIGRIREFLDTVAKEYPKVKIMSAIGTYDRWTWISRNTNGTEYEAFAGRYYFSIEICASEGGKTTGLDYTGFATKDLDKPFIEMGDVREKLDHIRMSLEPVSLEGKFEGTVIMTPGQAMSLISMAIYNFAGDDVIIDGTGLWKDKIGEKVADEKLTVALKPYDERIVMGERATANGFRTEEVTLIDKGVLKVHPLSLYAANKTGRPVMKNTGFDAVIEPGDKTFDEMIASVDKGLLLGGFSGGHPGANGEFSGVAKNSFLIENGKIKCAVTETMINGNLADVLKNITAVSKEQVCNGRSVVPYIAASGVVISGK
ncbi:MAG: TldD/PmbA family protein, partial [Lachnospiraceae bacterium]|nr:TldD/PmbA family protein [Lachnospiraceae bacterium]